MTESPVASPSIGSLGRRQPGPTSGGRRAGAVLSLAVCLTGSLALAGCAVPDRRGAGSGQVLYVANSLDGTLTPLDGAGGHVIGPPLPAGPAPSQLAPGPPGILLVASAAAGPGGPLTHVARAGPGWRARPLPLGEPAEVA